MRFKCRPEDFRVEEILGISLRPRGPFAVYRIKKRGVTTLSVEGSLRARLGVPRSALQIPALKDKQAVAVQHGSVSSGGAPLPPRVRGPGFEGRLAGFTDRPLSPADLRGNRFTIILRDLDPGGVQRLRSRFERLAGEGFPNYFGAQRFGSYAPDLGFPGRLILDRNWEGVLRAWLAEPQVGDERGVVPLKALAREHWGDFGRIAASAPRSHRRSILVFLRDHPTAFRKAVNLMEPRLLGLFLQALQSWLWNRIVSAYLEALARSLAVPLKRVALPPGEVVWPEMPPSEFVKRVGDERLPLPQSRAVISDAAMREAAASVLKSEGVAWRDLKARSVDRAWLSRGDRAVWVRPRGVRWLAEQEDDLHPGRRRVSLKFSLPPGSYASILLGALEYDGGALAE